MMLRGVSYSVNRALALFRGQFRYDRKHGYCGRLSIPICSEFNAHLKTAPPGFTYIVTGHGVARSEKAFTNWIMGAARAAVLPEHLSPHGLRKACCRRLAEVGCSIIEIMAITGQPLVVVERYIRDFNNEQAAEAAMKKMKGKA